MRKGYFDVAKAYILYSEERAKLREEKKKMLEVKELTPVIKNFDKKSLFVLKERYLKATKEKVGDDKIIIHPTETPDEMFERVAKTVSIVDFLYEFTKDDGLSCVIPLHISSPDYKTFYSQNHEFFDKYNLNEYHVERLIYLCFQLNISNVLSDIENKDPVVLDLFDSIFGKDGTWELYYNGLINQEFMFNTPVLMNFGRPLGGGNACFVLEAEDDLESIMTTCAVRTSKIFKKAGGFGINGSNWRPQGDSVGDIEDASSGPISWLEIVDKVTDVIKSGTGRRGANMGILEYWHPDILNFIKAKTVAGKLENFNVSVGLDDDFWDAFMNDSKFNLVNPRNKKIWGQQSARGLIDLIAAHAHASAEPGLLYFSNTNRYNPFKDLFGPLKATNPCGEQYLYPNDSCTLASINLSKFVKEEDRTFDFERFTSMCRLVTVGLDNVVSISKYPDEKIEETTKKFRRIGLGIMGLADMLFKMRIRYNSKEGFELMEKIAKTMHEESLKESILLAHDRGMAFNWKRLIDNSNKKQFDLLQEKVQGKIDIPEDLIDILNQHGIRNCWVGTEAPTGTISMIAGCTSGIEPLFGLYYMKKDANGNEYEYWNETFVKALKDEGIYSEQLLQKIIDNYSSCEGIDEIPKWIQETFVTAIGMHWADHVYAQSIWQKYVDNSISKTINFAKNATKEDIKEAYLLAYFLGCKGLSVYRDGSRHKQILHVKERPNSDPLVPSEYVKKFVREHFANMKEFIPSLFEPYLILDNRNINANITLTVDDVRNDVMDAMFLAYGAEGWIPNKQEEFYCKCGTMLVIQEGCYSCPNCGFSKCDAKWD